MKHLRTDFQGCQTVGRASRSFVLQMRRLRTVECTVKVKVDTDDTRISKYNKPSVTHSRLLRPRLQPTHKVAFSKADLKESCQLPSQKEPDRDKCAERPACATDFLENVILPTRQSEICWHVGARQNGDEALTLGRLALGIGRLVDQQRRRHQRGPPGEESL